MNLDIKILKPSNLNYAAKTLLYYFNNTVCPFCNSYKCKLIDRKWLIFRLYECNQCHLYFRFPNDDQIFNYDYYEEDYEQADGITTYFPSDEEIKLLIKSNFTETEKNASIFIKLFKILIKDINVKIIDYGSSWGYMSYQFLNSGFNVQSYEISNRRANFGNRKLNLDIKTNEKDLLPENEIFFSSHVIEHHKNIKEMLALAKRLLNREGYFIAECPNGSKEFRNKNPQAFHKMWGLVHPNTLNSEYYQHVFNSNPYFLTSSPYNFDEIGEWNQRSQVISEISGDQLLIVAKPNISL